MPTLSDAAPFYTGEALISEISREFSREVRIIASGAGVVKTCTVLGTVTATSKDVPLAPAAADGSQNASGVLIHKTDATTADVKAAVWRRGVVLNKSEVNFGSANAGQITTAITQLAALGIVVKASI